MEENTTTERMGNMPAAKAKAAKTETVETETVETPAPVEVKPDTAPLPKVFVIPEETVKAQVKRRKGHAKPHRLQPIVKDSFDRSAHVGVPLTRNDKGELVDSEGVGVTAVVAGLRTAARQLGYKIKVWDKTELETPYVAFLAFPPKTDAEKAEVKAEAEAEESADDGE